MTRPSRSILLIYIAAWLRSFGIGLLGVVLGVFLYRQGYSSIQIGFVIAAGLAGAALATLFVTLRADRLGRRPTLVGLSLLTAAAAVPFILNFRFSALLPFAFIGMLNGMGTDRSASFALEQAVLPGLVSAQRRTWSLSWYNVVLDSSGALGALAAGIPLLEQKLWGVNLISGYRTLFLGYALLNLLSGALYLALPSDVEAASIGLPDAQPPQVSPQTKSVVMRLSGLFALDSFGGGLLTDALVSYWFFRRFGITESKLGVLFFIVHLLNAFSHLGAAFIARRIGLVRTMVFTHLPSSLFLMAVPFASSGKWAVLLFLLRESLVEMDVPTRQSYVAAVVDPTERTFASGVTNLTRNLSWAVASSLAGILMQFAFSGPLLLGGGLKITYDILLYRAFRHVVPPEETRGQSGSS